METPVTPYVSIIVPVYNVENYLHQCINSILDQSFYDYELILVDDGSKDDCPAICDKYAEKDSRIKVIHKENGGLSDARNAGINIASGEYLIFVDGDDFISDESLEQIIKTLEKDGFPEVLFLNAQMYFNDGQIAPYGHTFRREYFYNKSHDEVLQQLTDGGQFHVSACVKVIKRRLIMDNGIFFTKGIIGEDVDFSIKLYLNAITYSYLSIPYYYYRQERTDSIMAQKVDKRFSDLMLIIRKWIDLSDDEYRNQKHWILKFLFHQYYVLILLYQNANKSLKTKETKRFFKHFSFLLKYTQNKKVVMFTIFYNIFGLNISSYIMNKVENKN